MSVENDVEQQYILHEDLQNSVLVDYIETFGLHTIMFTNLWQEAYETLNGFKMF